MAPRRLMDLLLPSLDAAAINAEDPAGKTALHWAVEMASASAVKRLVPSGAVSSERVSIRSSRVASLRAAS